MKSREAARRIYEALDRHHPNADTELVYRNPFELLVATILSAQSTDVRVNMVTPALFEKYPTAQALAQADTADVEPIIMSTGFFRQKSKAIVGMAKGLMEQHGGNVPADMEALTRLPGVGRKTANVVLGHALAVPGLPVDRHVLRVSNRLGLVASDDPVSVERTLCRYYPPPLWIKVSDLFILHGRRICRPKPLCDRCNARKDCDFYKTAAAAVRAPGRRAPRGKPGVAPRAIRMAAAKKGAKRR